MRIVFTLFLLLLVTDFLPAQDFACKTAGLSIVTADAATSTKDTSKRVVIRCGLMRRPVDREPLLVVDGEIQTIATLSSINPYDIEEIHILKNAAATAIYGHEAAAGVIIITTKSSKVRAFIIKDFLTGEEIPAVSVSFIRQQLQKDTLHFVSNDSGFISTNKLVPGGEYEAVITSTGYKPLNVKFNTGYINKQMILLLERDVKDCKVVRISATVCPKKINIFTRLSCAHPGMKIFVEDSITAIATPYQSTIIFPNPVTRGQSLTIQTESSQQSSLQAIVTDFSGKTVLQQNFYAAKGVNRFTVNTDSRWSAGMYLLHWKNEKGIVLQTQQIVVR